LVSDKSRQIEKIDTAKVRKRIVYEDDNWMVFDKPAGILVHPGNQHRKDLSMNDYLEKMVKA
jgi:23S rRNA-/tRNA-specific pseudouridylate synthase